MSDQNRNQSGSQGSSGQQNMQNTGSGTLQETYSDQDWAQLPRERQEEYHRLFPGRRQRSETGSQSSEGSSSR
jgi:hypothetical protein